MKKFLLIALAVVMMMTLAISAFAADPVILDSRTSAELKSTGNVTVNVTDFYAETVYYVEVTWGNLAFDYTQGTYTWDPVNLEYVVKDGSAGWVDAEYNTAESVTRADVIKVTNQSNAAIKATAEVTDVLDGVTVETAVDGVAGTEFVLNSAAPATVGGTAEVQSKEFDVTVGGTPSGTGIITIATITVTITAAE